MDFLRAYLRTLNPPLPRSVRTLQAGALINALGNGLAYPFLFIYLHNVRDIDLATAGLIVGTNAAVGLVAGPIVGSAHRQGRRPDHARVLALADGGRLRRLRVRRASVAGLPRQRDRRDRERRVLAQPVLTDRRPHSAGATAPGLRDAARDDEPRNRARRTRRRPDRHDREPDHVPGALPGRRRDLPGLLGLPAPRARRRHGRHGPRAASAAATARSSGTRSSWRSSA